MGGCHAILATNTRVPFRWHSITDAMQSQIVFTQHMIKMQFAINIIQLCLGDLQDANWRLVDSAKFFQYPFHYCPLEFKSAFCSNASCSRSTSAAVTSYFQVMVPFWTPMADVISHLFYLFLLCQTHFLSCFYIFKVILELCALK